MKTPDEYTMIISSAYKAFNLSLEEIAHSYPLYKLFPNDSSHKTEYNKDIQNLERIKSNLFINKNNLRRDSEIITQSISNKNDKIEELNMSNERLIKKLNTLENQNFAATGELKIRQFVYNINLAQNIILIIIITGSIGLYAFKKYK